MRRPRNRILAAAATLGVVGALAVPVGGASASVGGQGGAKCPLSALKRADKPVEITFWHSMGRANEETLVRLTDRFNSSQSDVKVNLVNQTTYRDTLDKYIAGLSTGDLPDLVQLEDTALQQAIDTRTILPAGSCVKADDYDTSSYVQRTLDYYTVEDQLWPLPFNVSNPIFYYDKNKFRAAGLDPDSPPENFDEVREVAQKLRDAGVATEAPMGIKLDAWHLEQWLAIGGKPYVNHGNGRNSRATEAAFDVKQGVETFTWLSDMVNSGLAVTNPAEGPSQFDNLLGIGNGELAMTIDSSASLGTISQVLSSGQFPDVELGVGRMPGPKGKGGVLVGGAALYIVNKSPKPRQAAAWEFAKFLNSAETQAEWAAGTGYVPVREDATELAPMQDLWSREPGYKVAFDQLTQGVNNVATAGPVIGDYQGVRDVVLENEQSMFTDDVKPKTALKRAAQQADDRIQEYNSRIGA